MMTMVKFELQKILKNKTILGSFLISIFLLGGIFFVGYRYSQYQFAARGNIDHGYSRDVDKKYLGDFTDEKVRLIVSDYLQETQERLSQEKEESEAWIFHPFYLFNWQINETFIVDNEKLYSKMSDESRAKPLKIDDLKLRTIKELGFKEFGKPLQIGNYAPWLDFYKVQGNIFILVSILLIFICSSVFADDKAKNMNQILLTSKYGRNKLTIAKISAALLMTFMLFIVFQIINYLIFSSMYDISGWSSHIQTNLDLKLFDFPLEWNHLQLEFWFLFLQIVGILFTAGMSLAFSALLSTPLSALTSAVGAYFLPALLLQLFKDGPVHQMLYLFPVNQTSLGKVLELFAGDNHFLVGSFIGNSILAFACLFLVGILMKVFSYLHLKNWRFA